MTATLAERLVLSPISSATGRVLILIEDRPTHMTPFLNNFHADNPDYAIHIVYIATADDPLRAQTNSALEEYCAEHDATTFQEIYIDDDLDDVVEGFIDALKHYLAENDKAIVLADWQLLRKDEDDDEYVLPLFFYKCPEYSTRVYGYSSIRRLQTTVLAWFKKNRLVPRNLDDPLPPKEDRDEVTDWPYIEGFNQNDGTAWKHPHDEEGGTPRTVS